MGFLEYLWWVEHVRKATVLRRSETELGLAMRWGRQRR